RRPVTDQTQVLEREVAVAPVDRAKRGLRLKHGLLLLGYCTMTTGQVACWTTCWLTDPSSSVLKPPRPRLPTTIRSTSAPRSSSASAGSPWTATASTCNDGRSSFTLASASSATSCPRRRKESNTTGSSGTTPGPYSAGGTAQADTMCSSVS